MGCNISSQKREVQSNRGLHQEARRISNTQIKFIPEGARKTTTKEASNQQNKEIIIRAKINDREIKGNKRTDEWEKNLVEKTNKSDKLLSRFIKKRRKPQ